MIKPTDILLAAALCLGSCEQGGSHRPPRIQPSKLKTAELRAELPGAFAATYQQLLAEAEPLAHALSGALEERAELRHRPVLKAAYGASSTLRFAGLTGLTPAGELVRVALNTAADHGLDPERFHASRIERELKALGTRASSPAPPDPPSRAELAPLEREIEELAGQPGNRERPPVTRLVAWLVSARSPLPRVAAAFKAARRARREQLQATTRLELTLADGLLHYALVQDRGNLKPIEQRARRSAAQAEERARAAGDTAPNAAAPAPPGSEVHPRPGVTARAAGAPKPGSPRLTPLQIFQQKGPEAYVQSRLLADLNGAEDPRRVRLLLELLPPRHPQYARLKQALVTYRALDRAGGWPTLKAVSRLRRGRRHRAVPALKERLALEGYFKGNLSDRFDGDLARAVEAFQETHQLRATGRPGAGFWRAINTPASVRVRSIELTMQRWRESAIGRSTYYVLVNIPDFHLEVWKGGKRLVRHKVIVGRNRGEKCDEQSERKVLAYATPTQAALIKTLIFCPYWNVTRFIKETELDPEQGKDPLYYPKHGFEVMKPKTRGEWVRELPGPANSLGFVKFIFPNPFETYVHDTPDKGLFQRPVRAYSHGCMRVESPWDLAKLLLSEDRQWEERSYQELRWRWRQMDFRSLKDKWDPDLYDHLVDQAEELETRVELTSWVDIFVEYYTVRVDDAGRIHFLGDIYGLDQRRLDPTEPKPCIPESKLARRGVRSVPRRLAALEQIAAQLAPRVLMASALIHTIKPGVAPGARRLIKKMKDVSKFNQYHQSLAQRIKAAHEELELGLKKRGYNWNDRLQEQAIQVERLLSALDALGRKARTVSDQVIALANRKR